MAQKRLTNVAVIGNGIMGHGIAQVFAAAGCQVTVDDTYVSQLHARVFSRDGQLFVEDLGSTNGTYLNLKKVQGPMVMQRGDKLQVGNTVMELV